MVPATLPRLIWIVMIAVLVCQGFPGTLQGQGKNDLKPEEVTRIDSLLNVMTILEKAGQLSMFASGWEDTGPSLDHDHRNLIREGKAGAVLNAYTKDFVRELQRIAVEESRLGIPLLFGFDVIHGHRTIFPIPLGQSCTWDPEAIGHADRIAATEATAEGLCWTFAPMVDIARDPRWGRVAEGAGEDPWLASKIAEARVKGFQGTDLRSSSTMMACAKHFAAYGAPQAGRDYGTVDVSLLSLYDTYLPPFKACADAGAGTFMTAFNEIAGIPCTANPWLINDLLKGSWKFDGFVVSDWTAVNELIAHGTAANIEDAAHQAINAGVDMDMVGGAYLKALPELLDKGEVKIETIDHAVRRVLEAKTRLGLFDDPYLYCRGYGEDSASLSREFRSFARRMVTESCVLLRNPGQILPIPPTVKTIAVIGPLGNSKQDMPGNWSAAGNAGQCVTLLEGILNNTGSNQQVHFVQGCQVNDSSTKGFDEALSLAKKADFVILALGENEWMSGEASSRSDIDLPGVQNQLAAAITGTGKPVAVVLFNGRPLAINSLVSLPVAVLESWFGGTEAGNGIADLLFGKVSPSGKLTMTFPRNEGQIPVYYNHKSTGRPYHPEDSLNKYVSRYIDCTNDPLFPFGFGLSYTTFQYSDLIVRVQDTVVTASVKVENTGDTDGKEIVQLYLHDVNGQVTRPVKELKGFQKVSIPKGSARVITFQITPSDLAYFHSNLQKSSEPGEYVLHVGPNSAETLSSKFYMKK